MGTADDPKVMAAHSFDNAYVIIFAKKYNAKVIFMRQSRL